MGQIFFMSTIEKTKKIGKSLSKPSFIDFNHSFDSLVSIKFDRVLTQFIYLWESN